MRELFDRLLQEGEVGIERLVAERTQEGVTLEFKEARGAGTGTLANEDRKTFAKALSAFANSAGGLLVFGVEARKGEDNVDCAQATMPISNIERFKSEATTASGQLLQPRHDGIVVEAIPSQRQPGAGYLLVCVERSERRPHRSEAAGQKQYFKRAGDSSFEMEHYDIEDAFKRSTSAELGLKIRLEERKKGGSVNELIIGIYICNKSDHYCKNPYFQLRNIVNGNHGKASTIFKETVDGGWHSKWSPPGHILHAGLEDRVGRFSILYTNPPYKTSAPDKESLFSFAWRCGAENARRKDGVFTMSIERLDALEEAEIDAMYYL